MGQIFIIFKFFSSIENYVVLLGHVQVHGGGLCTGELDNVVYCFPYFLISNE